MADKKTYTRIKTAGFLMVIPIVLVSGPLGGYLIADLLIKNVNFPGYATIICVILGFAASVRETIKILRIAIKSNE